MKLKYLTIAFATAILVLSSPAMSEDKAIATIDFETEEEAMYWWPVNDTVMGGRSSGGPMMENGHMVFSGVLNTNGGGFSSVRRPVMAGDMAGATSITLRVKSDGRDYKLRFRTDVTYYGRRVAFQKPIPVTKAGEWETVTVPLNNMRASLFGRELRGAEFVPGDTVETGFILADGVDGPFRLEVDWIKVN